MLSDFWLIIRKIYLCLKTTKNGPFTFLIIDFGFDHMMVKSDQNEWANVTWQCILPMCMQQTIQATCI